MRQAKWRQIGPDHRIRRTKLEIPGWAGRQEPRRDGSHEQPWHCTPFSEGAQYGFELFYPFENELIVKRDKGRLVLDGDFGPDPETGVQWPPFRNFGDDFYTYQLLLDLHPEEGFAIRTEPHPRFYFDKAGDVPIALPALVRRWWPMLFFIVFKSPLEGGAHVFRPNEPFAQIIILPEESGFELSEMDDGEKVVRELQARRIHASRDSLSAETRWTSSTGIVFDGTYRHMHRAARGLARKAREGTPQD